MSYKALDIVYIPIHKMWTNENRNGPLKSLLTKLRGNKQLKEWFSGLNKCVFKLNMRGFKEDRH